jgi:hypothetical protein
LASLLPGECLRAVREPDNAYDKHAVALYDGDLHVGYVPAADSPVASKLLREMAKMRVVYVGVPASTSIEIIWGD